ncbi:hypothetical protein VTK73DRAFT_7983 [Phialemonium thermophilum]|uniref:Uncharacterized protein n=1 Tax=Phialemonium thermophilum TaxID=223376 RepID=A0ABR3WBC4_9PEZI
MDAEQGTDLPAPLSVSQQALIISAFTGSGKTYLATCRPPGGRLHPALPVVDLDSAPYSFLPGGTVRNPHFRRDYLSAILREAARPVILLVSTHGEVRSGMVALGLRYVLVYPARTLLDEWTDRLHRRGSGPEMLALIREHWDQFVGQCELQEGCAKVVLREGQYLTHVVQGPLGPEVQRISRSILGENGGLEGEDEESSNEPS